MIRFHFLLSVVAFLFRITAVNAYETVEDAARIARQLVDSSEDSIGTMATVFPSDHPETPGLPFALQEYYASCHYNGSLTLIFLPISRHSRNILSSADHSASITIASGHPAARQPRVSLLGRVTIYEDINTVPDLDALRECYLGKHPDARWWLPDDDKAAHLAYWAIFDPQTIYFVGGFGDEHYIGYVPVHLYQTAGSQNVETNSQTALSIAGRLQVPLNSLS